MSDGAILVDGKQVQGIDGAPAGEIVLGKNFPGVQVEAKQHSLWIDRDLPFSAGPPIFLPGYRDEIV
ncbi:hypothetical protein [Novosphingobium sp. M1R2S20]|uniref:Uncharacterized protein n=1 Tax=Novosphingobium rhizovicinum TaxID=3228928 RepID=A0ABV3RD15_9SPHN